MAEELEKVGDTGLRFTLRFPDARERESFEIAFRGWLREHERAVANQRLVRQLAERAPETGAGEMVDYLRTGAYTNTDERGGEVWVSPYCDIIRWL